ncbi:MAG: DNA double-strand break repair nuclease NurA [Chloroflexota bacterium]|nr:DNA double-strand break repair nuclease NurA [Chloroflexota bacterium]
MLHASRAARALEANLDRFTGYDRTLSDDLAAYRDALARLEGRSAHEISAPLPGGPTGALPSPEWDTYCRPVLPFGVEFTNHEEAREWAARTLYDRITFAADGSQIQPLPDISVPVAAVQVGWFENPHNPDVPYIKDVHVEVLPPDEVFVVRNGVSVFSDQRVSLRRFELEVDRLCEWMQEHSGVRPLPVAFFDGSLVVSFAENLEPQTREFYIQQAVRLLSTSERTRVPLVGYVDSSRARDLTTMLAHAYPELEPAELVTDAGLLRGSMNWGDRTPAWLCNREGVLADYKAGEGDGAADLSDRVCFLYLKTSASNVPARLDLPRWVVEEGQAEDVAQIVRAEAVVGNGYPYAIETADAVAVITSEDRRRFYGLFEQFAERNGIRLRVASKIQSKYRRR